MHLDFILVFNVLNGNIDPLPQVFFILLENYPCFTVQAKTLFNFYSNIFILMKVKNLTAFFVLK